MNPKVYGHTYNTLVQYAKIYIYCLRASSHWLQTCTVSMAMVMVGYTCVQSFIVMHPTIAYSYKLK